MLRTEFPMDEYRMKFELVELSVLKVFKVPLQELGGFADHYYLSESASLHNSIGWGPNGLELRGKVRITSQEFERVENFVEVAKYNIAVHNCEHFANYVLHGINLSSQQHLWWKCLGSEVISSLQIVGRIRDNHNNFVGQQIASIFSEDLMQAKIAQANRERLEFWKSRGVDIK